jgi:hypothetical protein
MTAPDKLYIKCTISGEPARILLELKQRGLVNTNKDAVNQGLCALYNNVLERDLKQQKLRENTTNQETRHNLPKN